MATQPTPWIDGLTIGQVLRETARRHADRDAMVFCHLNADGSPRQPEATAAPAGCYRRTWRELDAEVDRVARSLLALNVQKGEPVACWATNWPQWVQLQLAAARVGAIFVTVNPAYRSSELAYVLKQSDTALLFLIDRFRKSDYFAILQQALGAGDWHLAAGEAERATDAPGGMPVPDERGSTDRAGDRRSADRAELSNNVAGGKVPVPYAHHADFPKLRSVISMKSATLAGMLSWHEFLELGEGVDAEELAARERQLQADEAINVQYTSGTTGFPKGATLTHRNILMNAYYIGDCQNITAEDRIGVPVPFYHCFGCVLGILCCTVYGSALVVPAEHFDAAATLEAIEAEGCTSLYGVPTMFIAQLNHPSFTGRDLTSLRTGIMAGSPCPIEIMQRVVKEMHAREITIAYGLTEAAPVITQTRVDDPLELRVQTVGRPLPGVEVQLVDPLSGDVIAGDWFAPGTDAGASGGIDRRTAPVAPVSVPPERGATSVSNDTTALAGDRHLADRAGQQVDAEAGEVPVPSASRQGELCTRGHGVMLGYYNMPEATAAAIDADGWLHSGDLAVRLPNGYYRITGRIKDMICRGGENIYPREIEEFLYSHPAIQDVAVFGVPDERYVEEVAAWVKLRDGATLTEDELKRYCCDHLAHYKVPRYVRFVEEFPQTVTGKIQKFRMRELMQDELGLKASETA